MEGMHPHLPDPFGMLYGAYRIGYPSMPFEQSYRCYPASFIDKPQLENGDKVIMPPSALDRLASLRIDYPMLFELHNPLTNRISHCGVLEFIAEEGMIYMPYWMMQNMLLQEGDVVRVKSATLPKGTYVKLQPHTKDFLDIFNPKAVLETTLRNFSCLTVGDNIMVAYNNKQYYIDIIEAKPASAISIIETDCEVDFAPPLDYKEPEPVPPPAKPDSSTPQGGSEKKNSEGETAVEPKLSAFSGVGRRLDGKSSKFSPVPATTSSHSTTNTKPSGPSSGPIPSGSSRPSGKLVFGSGRSNAPPTLGASSSNNGSSKPPPPAKKEEKEQKEEPKFQAFSGRKYSLKG